MKHIFSFIVAGFIAMIACTSMSCSSTPAGEPTDTVDTVAVDTTDTIVVDLDSAYVGADTLNE